MRDEVRDTAVSMWESHKQDNPRFLVTGISLGGALSAHASYDLSLYLKTKDIKPSFLFYTYGQPRIGNGIFAKQVDS